MVSLKILNYFIEATLAVIIVVGSAFWSWTFFLPSYLAPTKYLSMAILNNPVSVGDKFLIGHVTFDRRKNCPGTSNRFILRLLDEGNSEEIIYRDTTQVATTVIGEGIGITFKVPLPDDLKPGRYVYRGVVRFDCDDHIFTIEAPSAPFNVR